MDNISTERINRLVRDLEAMLEQSAVMITALNNGHHAMMQYGFDVSVATALKAIESVLLISRMTVQ